MIEKRRVLVIPLRGMKPITLYGGLHLKTPGRAERERAADKRRPPVAAEDWLPPGFDYYDFDDVNGIECNRCGVDNLAWTKINGSWRLTTVGGELHECHTAAASAEDFDD